MVWHYHYFRVKVEIVVKVTQNWNSGIRKSVADSQGSVADFALYFLAFVSTIFGGRMDVFGGRF
jgi:hypothetical protein